MMPIKPDPSEPKADEKPCYNPSLILEGFFFYICNCRYFMNFSSAEIARIPFETDDPILLTDPNVP